MNGVLRVSYIHTGLIVTIVRDLEVVGDHARDASPSFSGRVGAGPLFQRLWGLPSVQLQDAPGRVTSILHIRNMLNTIPLQSNLLLPFFFLPCVCLFTAVSRRVSSHLR